MTGVLSEKLQRKIGRYVSDLVRESPRRIRWLFESERVRFVISDEGLIALAMDPKLNCSDKGNVETYVANYFVKNRSSIFTLAQLH